MSDADILIRLCAASGAGILLGVDRELRGISAGIRTHALVALSSAVITVSAMLLSDEFSVAHPGQNLDPLRVVQGLAQAIGFIAAGAIFVAKGDVRNLDLRRQHLACRLRRHRRRARPVQAAWNGAGARRHHRHSRARAGAPDPRQRQGAHRLVLKSLEDCRTVESSIHTFCRHARTLIWASIP